MQRTAKLGLQDIYERHTEQVYRAMAGRVKAKLKLPLPFTLTEYRVFVLDKFGGNWDGVVQCCYCTRWLNVQTFVTDHVEPLKFGGGIDLDNLDLCCEECNCLKGALSASGFRRFIEFTIAELHPQDAKEIMGRMKNGSAYLRTRIVDWKAKKAPQKVTNSLASRELVG